MNEADVAQPDQAARNEAVKFSALWRETRHRPRQQTDALRKWFDEKGKKLLGGPTEKPAVAPSLTQGGINFGGSHSARRV